VPSGFKRMQLESRDCLKTSVQNYYSTLCNSPEERSYRRHRHQNCYNFQFRR
jgi:hypothetical protein